MKDIDLETADMSQPFQAQAPICPFCYDDHASTRECDERELKKEMLKKEFDSMMNHIHDEKFNADWPNKIRRMIQWL